MNSFITPVERASNKELENEKLIINNSPAITEFLKKLSGHILILNSNRQIVYANKSFTKLFGFNNEEELIGKRPGEAINCTHAFSNDEGCGSSEFCKDCGALSAILEAQSFKTGVRECTIKQDDGNELELIISAMIVKAGKIEFILFAIGDRRKN